MQTPEVIRKLSIDLETYSSVSIKYGVYPYAESPDAEILLFGYSINDKPVTVVDVANGEEIPDYILSALTDSSVEKWAINASFERTSSRTGLSAIIQNNFKVTAPLKILLAITSIRHHGNAA